jgi:hypothetical protein
VECRAGGATNLIKEIRRADVLMGIEFKQNGRSEKKSEAHNIDVNGK